MDKSYKVIVTGIGGNVGQGIMRNIIHSKLPISIIGTNIEGYSAGNHLADKIYVTPYAWDTNFIPTIQKIVDDEKIDLIVPSTDFESFYLAVNKEKINCKVATSDAAVCEAYLDKYLTWKRHVKFDIPFADTILPSGKIPKHWNGLIAKPRKGRGSRGIEINPKSVDKFTDDEYMFQNYIEGEEITTAFYVTLDEQLHGQITMTRKLENGTTVGCEVTKIYDEKLLPIIVKMIQAGGLRGAVNIQSRINKLGEIIPFEINCRVSGTNSIRAQFGFTDVLYLLQENLLNINPTPCKIIEGKAMRILMDVIYPECKIPDNEINSHTKHIVF